MPPLAAARAGDHIPIMRPAESAEEPPHEDDARRSDAPGGPPDVSHIRIPRSLLRYILKTSALPQFLLGLVTVAAFLIDLAPLELQRRIVNDLVKHREFGSIILLCAIYGGVVVMQGATKLAVNIYRSWIGERATRDLRRRIRAVVGEAPGTTAPEASGVEVSMIVAEVEPIGGFVGESISEPLLHGGVLLSTIAYMLHVDLWVAAAVLALFVPQVVLVPLLQRAINRRTESRVQLLRKVGIGVLASEDAAEGPHEVARDQRIDRVFELNMGIYRLKFSLNFVMNLCNHLQIVVVLLVGGWLVLQGRIEVGAVVAFISAIGRLKDPWDEFVDYFRNMAVTQVKFRLVSEALDSLAHGKSPVASAVAD